ncbi:hypothetical protein GQ42DRAFT_64104 [Ramicandelaber brevisporus]|nr:hypothetical protein GQ42DRAFT_64104 [Ramicandelaber brevisporus]
MLAHCLVHFMNINININILVVVVAIIIITTYPRLGGQASQLQLLSESGQYTASANVSVFLKVRVLQDFLGSSAVASHFNTRVISPVAVHLPKDAHCCYCCRVVMSCCCCCFVSLIAGLKRLYR